MTLVASRLNVDYISVPKDVTKENVERYALTSVL